MGYKLLFGLLAVAGMASAANYKRVACPDGIHTATNAACCIFFSLADELQSSVFQNICFEQVHRALRLSFQDAIGFSFMDGPKAGGGADGSIITFETTELKDPANMGIDIAINDTKFLLQKFNVTPGDLIQFAAAVGITNCPGYPRQEFLAGRPVAVAPAQLGLISIPQDNVDDIFDRMEDAGFSPTELYWAHELPFDNRVQVPFDTTPFVFDSQYYLEVLLMGDETHPPAQGQVDAQVPSVLALSGEFRLQSDFAISRSPRSNCFWQFLVNDQFGLQQGFHDAMAKVAIVGQDAYVSGMIDYSEVIPMPVPPVNKSTTFPAGTGPNLLELSCNSPFPSLAAASDPGFPTTILPCPQGDCPAMR
ncbi:manganese peroxidase 1 [Schizopora paradoxa]|uniref:Peroxidase n=1 Tax=Schizopora paradoxa TaxID=27342 RepID=A0A0H2RF39_9AGAM|nr:manganese peroxidase 1 [Schizopora paradoxa]